MNALACTFSHSIGALCNTNSKTAEQKCWGCSSSEIRACVEKKEEEELSMCSLNHSRFAVSFVMT